MKINNLISLLCPDRPSGQKFVALELNILLRAIIAYHREVMNQLLTIVAGELDPRNCEFEELF